MLPYDISQLLASVLNLGGPVYCPFGPARTIQQIQGFGPENWVTPNPVVHHDRPWFIYPYFVIQIAFMTREPKKGLSALFFADKAQDHMSYKQNLA